MPVQLPHTTDGNWRVTQAQQTSNIVMRGNTAPFHNTLKFHGHFSDSRVEIYREILPTKVKKCQNWNSHRCRVIKKKLYFRKVGKEYRRSCFRELPSEAVLNLHPSLPKLQQMACTGVDGQGCCHLLLYFHLSASVFYCMKLFVNEGLRTSKNTSRSMHYVLQMLPAKQQAAPRALIRVGSQRDSNSGTKCS